MAERTFSPIAVDSSELDPDTSALIAEQTRLNDGQARAASMNDQPMSALGAELSVLKARIRDLRTEAETAADAYRPDIEAQAQLLAAHFHARRDDAYKYFFPDMFHRTGFSVYTRSSALVEAMRYGDAIETLGQFLIAQTEPQPVLKVASRETTDRYVVHGFTTPGEGFTKSPRATVVNDQPSYADALYLEHPITQPFAEGTSREVRNPALKVYLNWGVRRHVDTVVMSATDGIVESSHGYKLGDKFIAVGALAVEVTLSMLEGDEQRPLEVDLDQIRTDLLG